MADFMRVSQSRTSVSDRNADIEESVLDAWARVNVGCACDQTVYPHPRRGQVVLVRLPGLEALALPAFVMSHAERWARAGRGWVPLPYAAPDVEHRLIGVAVRLPGSCVWVPQVLPPQRVAPAGTAIDGDEGWRAALFAAMPEIRRWLDDGYDRAGGYRVSRLVRHSARRRGLPLPIPFGLRFGRIRYVPPGGM